MDVLAFLKSAGECKHALNCMNGYMKINKVPKRNLIPYI